MRRSSTIENDQKNPKQKNLPCEKKTEFKKQTNKQKIPLINISRGV